MQSEKLSGNYHFNANYLLDIALDRVPVADLNSREVEQSRSRSHSHQTRSRSHSRGQSKSVSRSRSHSYRHESRNDRSRSTSMRREGGDFSSRRGEIGYECIQSFSNSERFSLIVRGFRDRIEYILNTKMSCSRHVLEDVFSKYGKVTDVHIPRDYYTQYIYN